MDSNGGRHLRAQAGFAWQHPGSAGSWVPRGWRAVPSYPAGSHSCGLAWAIPAVLGPDLMAAGTMQPWRPSQGSVSSPTTQEFEARARAAPDPLRPGVLQRPRCFSFEEEYTGEGWLSPQHGGAKTSSHPSSGLATASSFVSPCLCSGCFLHQSVLLSPVSSRLPLFREAPLPASADLSVHSLVCCFLHLFLSH